MLPLFAKQEAVHMGRLCAFFFGTNRYFHRIASFVGIPWVEVGQSQVAVRWGGTEKVVPWTSLNFMKVVILWKELLFHFSLLKSNRDLNFGRFLSLAKNQLRKFDQETQNFRLL